MKSVENIGLYPTQAERQVGNVFRSYLVDGLQKGWHEG